MDAKQRLAVYLLRALTKLKDKYRSRDRRRGRRQRIKAARARRRDRERALVDSLRNKPCKDCNLFYGVKHMEFDHLPEFEKLFSVGDCRRGYQHTINEAAKCDVVCCKCHEKRELSRGRRHGIGRKGRRCPNYGLNLTPVPWPE